MDTKQLLATQYGLNQTLTKLALGSSLKQSLTQLTELAESLRPDVRVSILQYHPQTQTLTTLAAPSLPQGYNQLLHHLKIGPDVGTCGRTAYQRCFCFSADITTDPNWHSFREHALAADIRACWSVPIFSSKQRLLGTFALYLSQALAPCKEDKEFMELISSVAAVAIEKEQMEAELYFAATHDALTQVANRHHFLEKLNHTLANCQRQQRPIALFYMDIDRFKAINDSFGHQMGDQVLIHFAHRIESVCRKGDLLGRIGGDEFLLMCPLKTEQDLDDIEQRLRQALAKHAFRAHIQLSGSIGAALWSPNRPIHAEQLIAEADAKMYQHKHSH
ncbi:sensor domain-containing diguanylate cyclase [Ferrimonas aestuarii]|uniref:Sensor domain-containing diguanylate cyclase n=1 Tax=Ferrimonas aestuarii TaxID=2569539 RepID=A0A4U1BM62_9GAMM|nr:sensor domain-containing diguanylate cyclase [Ferrimonas aestuarii]TKB54245.1 sensor domain-containing diguanylate cyclase [Ferrimonas aestuarii]